MGSVYILVGGARRLGCWSPRSSTIIMSSELEWLLLDWLALEWLVLGEEKAVLSASVTMRCVSGDMGRSLSG